MIFNVASSKPSVPYSVPVFTYSGTAPSLKYSGNNWEIAFTGECDITFQRVSSSIDIFVVAGGQPGSSGTGSRPSGTGDAHGGAGGKGGGYKTVTKSVSAGVKYSAKIGGSNTASSFGCAAWAVTANPGGGSSGGTGAVQTGTTSTPTAATAGSDTGNNTNDCAFGTDETLHWPGYKYAAGGGGGGAYNAQYQGGWSEGAYGAGGYTVDGQRRRAGGQGGISTYASGKAGAKNSGGGGGGGASDESDNATNFPGGAGGSGIVIIRNHR